jgi:hypothetical protein
MHEPGMRSHVRLPVLLAVLVVALAAALIVQALTDSAIASIAVLVVLASVGAVRSLWFGDLSLLRRRSDD